MDPVDLEIRKRLDKLKEPLPDAPSADELQKRLRVLKGLPEEISKKYIQFPKPRSNVEQVDDLMNQYTEENALSTIASTSASVEALEQRLKKLKAENSEKTYSNEPPRESDNKILLKKILAEADLEKKTENKFPQFKFQTNVPEPEPPEPMNFSDDSDVDSADEFCYICDKRPVWVCLNCDKEEFCNKCYKEYHDELGECHKRKSIKRKKKRYSDSE